MALAVEAHPRWRTIPELAREIGGNGGGLTRAIMELVQIGLLEIHRTAIRPSKAIAYFERLELPYAR
jgi:hypothetical protein